MSDPPATIQSIPGLTDFVRVGRGGQADVYRARDEALNRLVAVKHFPAELIDTQSSERARREIRALGTLSDHPGVVTVYSHGELSDGSVYMILAWMAGGDLRLHAQQVGPIPFDLVCPLLALPAAALGRAHSEKIIHRDVKPSNILLDRQQQPALADFGIAAFEGAVRITKTGVALGSAPYVDPWLIATAGTATAASDVYSLAATALHLLSGRGPLGDVAGLSDSQLVHRLREYQGARVPANGMSAESVAIVEAALAPTARDRPTMSELQAVFGLPTGARRLDDPIPTRSQDASTMRWAADERPTSLSQPHLDARPVATHASPWGHKFVVRYSSGQSVLYEVRAVPPFVKQVRILNNVVHSIDRTAFHVSDETDDVVSLINGDLWCDRADGSVQLLARRVDDFLMEEGRGATGENELRFFTRDGSELIATVARSATSPRRFNLGSDFTLIGCDRGEVFSFIRPDRVVALDPSVGRMRTHKLPWAPKEVWMDEWGGIIAALGGRRFGFISGLGGLFGPTKPPVEFRLPRRDSEARLRHITWGRYSGSSSTAGPSTGFGQISITLTVDGLEQVLSADVPRTPVTDVAACGRPRRVASETLNSAKHEQLVWATSLAGGVRELTCRLRPEAFYDGSSKTWFVGTLVHRAGGRVEVFGSHGRTLQADLQEPMTWDNLQIRLAQEAEQQ